MPDPSDIEHDLRVLEAEIKKLEAEYNMYFAGRLPRPPWETRGRVDALIKRWDRAHIQTAIARFRFNTLQTRYSTFTDLWDRGMRAREEGRPGPFAHQLPPPADKKKEKDKEKEPAHADGPKVVQAVTFRDPSHEADKLHALYDSLMEARRSGGEDVVPFHKFAALIKEQVRKIREGGSPEVTFRVAVKEGKVSFTARGVKGKHK